MWLLQLNLRTVSFIITCQVVSVSVWSLYFLLQITEKETGDIRLCTEAELKAGGRWADDSKYDVVPITFDEE